MYQTSSFIFWITLALYILTLCLATYVGVYLSYFAIPVIIFFGLVMKLTKPKSDKPQSEFAKATVGFLNELNLSLDKINHSLSKFNKKMELIEARTRELENQKTMLERQKIKPNIEIKYAKSREEVAQHEKLIKEINLRIIEIDNQIRSIKKQCELEIEGEY